MTANTEDYFLKLQGKNFSSLLCILLYITEKKNRVLWARGSSFARVCCMHVCCCMRTQVCLWCLLAGIFLPYLSFWGRVGHWFSYKTGQKAPEKLCLTSVGTPKECLGCFVGVGDPHSGTHAYIAKTLPLPPVISPGPVWTAFVAEAGLTLLILYLSSKCWEYGRALSQSV